MGGNVTLPIAILLGDVNSTFHVDGADIGAVQRQNSQTVTLANFRMDVNESGHIDGGREPFFREGGNASDL